MTPWCVKCSTSTLVVSTRSGFDFVCNCPRGAPTIFTHSVRLGPESFTPAVPDAETAAVALASAVLGHETNDAFNTRETNDAFDVRGINDAFGNSNGI